MERFEISEATPQDLNEVKQLMLTALKTDPMAFSSDYKDYAIYTEIWWQNYLYSYLNKVNARLIIAKQNGRVKGMVGLTLDSREKRKHVGTVVWFYVEPESRQFGVGKELFKSLFLEIKKLSYLKKVNLNVYAQQTNALKIYNSFGFEIVGTQKQEILVNNQYIDKYIMELFL